MWGVYNKRLLVAMYIFLGSDMRIPMLWGCEGVTILLDVEEWGPMRGLSCITPGGSGGYLQLLILAWRGSWWLGCRYE